MARRLAPGFSLAALTTLICVAAACARPPRPAETLPAPVVPAAEPVVPAPAPAPLRLACKARIHVCAEYEGVPTGDAATLRQRCAAEGGEVLDTCPADKVVGTCTASRTQMTVRQHVYRAKTGRETRGLVFDSKRACESKGGTFTAP